MKAKDSISESIEIDDIVNDINLSLDATGEDEYVVVLVEGISDERFLNKHVKDHVEVTLPALENDLNGGCSKVEKIIEQLKDMRSDDKRVIAIVDRDYKEEKAEEEFFYYDHNSLETFLFSLESVLEGICSEFCINREDKSIFRLRALKNLKELGIIRKLSNENNWGLNLKNLPISKFYDETICKLDINELINIVKLRNKAKFEADKTILEKIEENIKSDLDYEQLLRVVQGHDLVAIIKCECDLAYKKRYKCEKEFNKDSIESTLRSSCTIEDLSNTNLYKSINNYETKYDLKIFKVAN